MTIQAESLAAERAQLQQQLTERVDELAEVQAQAHGHAHALSTVEAARDETLGQLRRQEEGASRVEEASAALGARLQAAEAAAAHAQDEAAKAVGEREAAEREAAQASARASQATAELGKHREMVERAGLAAPDVATVRSSDPCRKRWVFSHRPPRSPLCCVRPIQVP